jgi:hypothetical protein
MYRSHTMNKRSDWSAPKKCTELQVPGKKIPTLEKASSEDTFRRRKAQMFQSLLTEAEGRRELTQHGVLPCLAGREVGEGALIWTVLGTPNRLP